MKIIKYTLLYIVVVSGLASLLVLRKFGTLVAMSSSLMWKLRSFDFPGPHHLPLHLMSEHLMIGSSHCLSLGLAFLTTALPLPYTGSSRECIAVLVTVVYLHYKPWLAWCIIVEGYQANESIFVGCLEQPQ
jgi:hypothetical protein